MLGTLWWQRPIGNQLGRSWSRKGPILMAPGLLSSPEAAGATGTDPRQWGQLGSMAAGCYTPSWSSAVEGGHPRGSPLPAPCFSPRRQSLPNSLGCPVRKKNISSKSFISSFRPSQFLLLWPAGQSPRQPGCRWLGGMAIGNSWGVEPWDDLGH